MQRRVSDTFVLHLPPYLFKTWPWIYAEDFFRNTEKREFIEVLVGNPKYITCGETYKTQRQNTSKHHDSPHYSIMNCHLGWQNTSQFSQGMFVRANLRYSARNTEF
jgi:hypothetical protein